MSHTVLNKLLQIRADRGAGFLALLEPDKLSASDLVDRAACCEANGVDALLIGSSLMLTVDLDEAVSRVKAQVDIPVVLFPGALHHISRHADAILFLSLISGRNPQYLIGEQVHAAPVIQAYDLEPISTGYILIGSESITSAEFMSNTRPIPPDKSAIAVAHALAAEYLGMHMVYLDAGSGARPSIPESLVQAVAANVSIPVIVGGGIRSPDTAHQKVEAGADFVVIGTVLEENAAPSLIREFSEAIHSGQTG